MSRLTKAVLLAIWLYAVARRLSYWFGRWFGRQLARRVDLADNTWSAATRSAIDDYALAEQQVLDEFARQKEAPA